MNGNKEQEGPRNEVEENQVNEQWKVIFSSASLKCYESNTMSSATL